MTNDKREPLVDDLLEGAAAISEFIFGTPARRRRVYQLAEGEENKLPTFRMGSTICSRKSSVIAWMEKLEGAA